MNETTDIVDRLKAALKRATGTSARWIMHDVHDGIHEIVQLRSKVEQMTADRRYFSQADEQARVLLGRISELENEVQRLTLLHERVASHSEVAKAYQEAYFQDFPTVANMRREMLLAQASYLEERALADQLAEALSMTVTAHDSWCPSDGYTDSVDAAEVCPVCAAISAHETSRAAKKAALLEAIDLLGVYK